VRRRGDGRIDHEGEKGPRIARKHQISVKFFDNISVADIVQNAIDQTVCAADVLD
jgi:hypothetical protein